jgi:hypothetical protein
MELFGGDSLRPIRHWFQRSIFVLPNLRVGGKHSLKVESIRRGLDELREREGEEQVQAQVQEQPADTLLLRQEKSYDDDSIFETVSKYSTTVSKYS